MKYTNLVVWQKADELALTVYQLTRKFPKEEMYGITAQLRMPAQPATLQLTAAGKAGIS